MPHAGRFQLDVLILGGGASGLWLLDVLRRRGFACVLLERGDLGSGQTVCSQGIIHGGVKYALAGALTASAANLSDMPGLWRDLLAGSPPGGLHPDLSAVHVRADACCLWGAATLRSKLSMAGAAMALAVRPRRMAREECPAALRDVKGSVLRLDEQVIDPASLIEALAARNADSIIRGDDPEMFDARTIVLTAGRGNAGLREQLGLDAMAQQLRPLHMVVVRGESLSPLNGHCIDGARTRLTITTDHDARGTPCWQVGGELAERGVILDAAEQIRCAATELEATIPAFASMRKAGDLEWMTYTADRAEARCGGGQRPDDVQIIVEAHPRRADSRVITAWPTKLALVPRLVERVLEHLGEPERGPVPMQERGLEEADRPPVVATPPWRKEDAAWMRID